MSNYLSNIHCHFPSRPSYINELQAMKILLIHKKDPSEIRWAWVMGSFISRRLRGVMQPPQIVIFLIEHIRDTMSSVYLGMTKNLTVTKVFLAG